MTTRLDHAAVLLGDNTAFEALPLSGGDLSEIWHLRFASGRDVVVKLGGDAEAEAEMLRAIAETGAGAPDVLTAQGDLLILEYLPACGLTEQGWKALGKSLFTLHNKSQPSRYGWHRNYAFGAMPIPNGWTADWCSFWREYRLLPCSGFLPKTLAFRVNRLADRLDGLLPRTPRAALLHGDLWSGNVLMTGQSAYSVRSVLIDPACYIGDASTDFAMLTLFSTPPEAFWQSYGCLPEGYERSIDVYRLWPALVHYRLFGTSYLGMIESLLDRLNV
ncbi:fructosamine kinase family protein [Asaia astilbis]|uniref:fructosamine kinase family protein n=1 Tax=Asaia astilbis TaxID=610244 RepID=UPI0004711901|nr:fructosamine kinase family protein [Asaia astilbis]